MSEASPKIDITQLDKNFVVPGVGEFDVTYTDVTAEPLKLEGLPWYKANGNEFYRIPKTIADEYKEKNSSVYILSNCTSGAAVRFATDSKVVTLRGKLAHSLDMNHMPRAGSAGFDSYIKTLDGKWVYKKTFQPNRDQIEFEALIGLNDSGEMQEWLINFPLYGGVEIVEVGVEKNSTLQAPVPHKVEKPILFYGSSITQGGCASRPGNNYTSMLCRAVDSEQINMGFSGSARGEDSMAEAIASLDLAVFVYDYDHNAPSAEHLQNTHERFFKIIRAKNPDLPVIIMNRCDYYDNAECRSRRDIVRATYENAIASGDKKVWFIDGETLFEGDLRDSCTVDGCHPNDLGFFRMYAKVLPVLEKALAK
jgi:lysophospholipase L1-like esterase